MKTRLLVASQNQGKVREFSVLLSGLGDIEWLSLKDVGLGQMEVEETGATFEENARLKAEAYSQASGLLTLADDSGLVVDVLDGAPGIYSARYGAPELKTDANRYTFLLKNLAGIPHEKRTARFVCVVAIALPNEPIQFARGTVEGHIAEEPRGSYGFGYDPVFLLPDGRHLAEVPPDEKQFLSHRGHALHHALPILRQYLR